MTRQNKAFKAEIQQLLDLVIHSLYTKKEIYLRELISNASDAIDRARYEGLTNPAILAGDTAFKIRIAVDKTARTVSISDNGIGMNAAEMEANLGTIASSGTKKFLAGLGAAAAGGDKAELIGQFGVGFYSAFMVADKVTVTSLRRGPGEKAVAWESAGTGEYTQWDAEKSTPGTEITLQLREGMDEFLNDWGIRDTVKRYSDYVAYPICMDAEHEEYPKKDDGSLDYSAKPTIRIEEETLNSMKALWRRAKAEIKPEEYTEFYHHISHDHVEPMETIHFTAEGASEFRALLYIPKKAPMDLFYPDRRKGVHLYVKNVFIMDDCKELLPEYLRFVRGVVDSSDLPLNVSREMLQDDVNLKRIRKGLLSRILSTLATIKEKRPDDYQAFWNEFGRAMKEGLPSDHENKEKLQDLLLFPSTATEAGKGVSLRDYVNRAPVGQKDIYYISGDSVSELAGSPHVEALKKRNYEVLLFADPIDEWVSQSLHEYSGKKLVAADRGSLDLGSDEEKRETEQVREAAEKEHKPLLEKLKELLGADIKEVRISTRLTDSACCLVADEHGMNAHMERIMKAMGQAVPPSARILELNPTHRILTSMKAIHAGSPDDPRLADYAFLLHNQALLAEGSPLRDTRRFTHLVSKLMATAG